MEHPGVNTSANTALRTWLMVTGYTLSTSTDDSNFGGVVHRAGGCAAIQRDFNRTEKMGLPNVCGKVCDCWGDARVASVGEGKGLPCASHSWSSQPHNSPTIGQRLLAHYQSLQSLCENIFKGKNY